MAILAESPAPSARPTSSRTRKTLEHHVKLLAVSDIHDNVRCVQQLVRTEDSDYDAVVVAGDIGSRRFPEVITTLADHFHCPVGYVYGNWDHDLAYDAIGHARGVHLHNEPICIKGVCIAGFSGCRTHWGHNPAAQRILDEISTRHRSILQEVESALAEAQGRERLVEEARKASLQRLARSAGDRRRKEHRSKVETRNRTYDTKVRRCWREYEDLKASTPYGRYLNDVQTLSQRAIEANLRSIRERLPSDGSISDRVIVVSHERSPRLDEHIGSVLVHIHGHRHTFKHTQHRGTHFVNTAALDQVKCVVPASAPKSEWAQSRCMVNAGCYSVVSIAADSQVEVEKRWLWSNDGSWKHFDFPARDLPWLDG